MTQPPMPERIRRLNPPLTRREWLARRARRVFFEALENPLDWFVLGVVVVLFVALMLRKAGA